MGLNMFGKTSSPGDGTPDPRRWGALRYFQLGAHLALMVRYPDATNYEGRKILVLRATLTDVYGQAVLDPHFTDAPGVISPIARLVPTDEGWKLALSLLDLLERRGAEQTTAKEFGR